jgi:hypothetical protein
LEVAVAVEVLDWQRSMKRVRDSAAQVAGSRTCQLPRVVVVHGKLAWAGLAEARVHGAVMAAQGLRMSCD